MIIMMALVFNVVNNDEKTSRVYPVFVLISFVTYQFSAKLSIILVLDYFEPKLKFFALSIYFVGASLLWGLELESNFDVSDN